MTGIAAADAEGGSTDHLLWSAARVREVPGANRGGREGAAGDSALALQVGSHRRSA